MRTHSVRRSRVQKVLPRIFQYLILSTVVVIVLVPIVLAIFGALKTRGEFMASPYTLPIPPRWDNFILILTRPSFWQMFKNSLIVTLSTTTSVVIICSLAAFVFARMEFRGKNSGFQLVYPGTDVSNQYCHLASVFVAAQPRSNEFISGGHYRTNSFFLIWQYLYSTWIFYVNPCRIARCIIY